MGKLINEKYPLKYTSTDFIAYTGILPDCVPSGTSSCQPMDRGLTKLMQLLLEKYCEEAPSANPLEADISELDIECLLEANPDIEIGDDLTLQDLLIYYKEHLCYIYDRLCAECGGETDLNCTISKTDCSGEFVISFESSAQYVVQGTEGSSIAFRIQALIGEQEFLFSEFKYVLDQENIIFDREDVLIGLQQNWQSNSYFDFELSGTSVVLTKKTCDAITIGFSVEDLLEPVTDIINDILVFYNGEEIPIQILQDGTIWFKQISSTTPVEITALICEFIQDHEDRITVLENETTPSSEPYVPDPVVIPIYRVINIQTQNEIVADIQHYFKYRTSDYYFSKTEDGTRLDSLTINGQTSLGTFGNLWLDSDSDYLRYKYTQETPFPTGDDTFSLYLTDGSGSNYVIPITIYSINACCEGEPVPSGEGFVYEYIIEFDVTGWNSEVQFQDTNPIVTRTPSGGSQSTSSQPSFVLRLTHNLGLVGTYSAVPLYLDSVAGVINIDAYDPDYVDIQLANNPFNTLGTNIKIKVIISQ